MPEILIKYTIPIIHLVAFLANIPYYIYDMNEDYSDIIDLPYEKLASPSNLSMAQRAAQFAPFQALNGYSRRLKDVDKAHELAVDNIEMCPIYDDIPANESEQDYFDI